MLILAQNSFSLSSLKWKCDRNSNQQINLSNKEILYASMLEHGNESNIIGYLNGCRGAPQGHFQWAGHPDLRPFAVGVVCKI